MAAGEFERRHQGGVTRGTETALPEQSGRVRDQQPAQAAEVLQQVSRELERIGAGSSGAEHHRQQFRVRKGLRAALDEPLARALSARPGADARAARGRGDLIHGASCVASVRGKQPEKTRKSRITAVK